MPHLPAPKALRLGHLLRRNAPYVHFVESADDALDEARAGGASIHRVAGGGLRDEATLFALVAEAMHFPRSFEPGWEAFIDQLREHAYSRATVLVVDRGDAPWKVAPLLVGTLTELWQDLALEAPHPIHLVFLLTR